MSVCVGVLSNNFTSDWAGGYSFDFVLLKQIATGARLGYCSSVNGCAFSGDSSGWDVYL